LGGSSTITCRFSKVINAPLRFVYDWCTDYREDDYKITGAKSRRLIIEKTKRRTVYINQQRGSKIGKAVNIVTLHPPNRWHLDSIGDQRNETGEYHLKKLGSRSVRLDMVFRINWKIPPSPTRAEFLRHLNESWGKYATALETDYENKSRIR
jgi:predicted DCC family thiol-disulfide oxidoreductase YuxK